MGTLAGILFSIGNGSVWVDDPETGPTLGFMVAGMVIIGIWGAICGFVAGGVCAVAAAWWARLGHRGGRIRYGVLAAGVSVVLCSAFSLSVIVPGSTPMPNLVVWWLLPAVVAGVAAAGVGALVWQLGAPRPTYVT